MTGSIVVSSTPDVLLPLPARGERVGVRGVEIGRNVVEATRLTPRPLTPALSP